MILIGFLGLLLILMGLGAIVWLHPRTKQWLQYRRSDEYRTQQHEAQLLRQRQRDTLRVSRQIKRAIVSSFYEQELTYRYRANETVGTSHRRRRKEARPEIKTTLFSSTEIWFRIDRKPRGISWSHLTSEDVLQELRVDIGRKACIWVFDTDDTGIWLRVFLHSTVMGVPKFFKWNDVDNKCALKLIRTSHPLEVPIGLGANSVFYSIDLGNNQTPHLLIGGSTGGGKTNLLNQIICTLLRNSYKNQKLVFIDLKRVEFWRYRKIPHLWHPVVTLPHEVTECLQKIQHELDRRIAMFQAADVSNIVVWNSVRTPKLPFIVVVFDEIANLMLNKEFKNQTEHLLANGLAQGRAFGIHFILCTQRPSVDVVTGLIKSNVPTRVSFKSDSPGSRTILENDMASNLPDVQGRAILWVGNKYVELQTPLITNSDVETVIKGLEAVEPESEFALEDIFRLALERYQGKFHARLIWEQDLKNKVSSNLLEQIRREWSYRPEERAPLIELGDSRYILAAVSVGASGTKPYYLVPVNDHLPTSDSEVQALFDEHAQRSQLSLKKEKR